MTTLRAVSTDGSDARTLALSVISLYNSHINFAVSLIERNCYNVPKSTCGRSVFPDRGSSGDAELANGTGTFVDAMLGQAVFSRLVCVVA